MGALRRFKQNRDKGLENMVCIQSNTIHAMTALTSGVIPRVAAAILRLLRLRPQLRLRSEVKPQVFWKNPTK